MHETHRLQLLGGLLHAAAEAVPGLAVGKTVILPRPRLLGLPIDVDQSKVGKHSF